MKHLDHDSLGTLSQLKDSQVDDFRSESERFSNPISSRELSQQLLFLQPNYFYQTLLQPFVCQ
jgi:hypothetical protein